MSLRRRRAAAPVSSSASIAMRPETMCRDPPYRNTEATSALRQQGLVTARRLSSSLTAAVIAIAQLPLFRLLPQLSVPSWNLSRDRSTLANADGRPVLPPGAFTRLDDARSA